MPSPWDILGLDGPTDDLRQIKKSYARKLKTTRPDDDPAAFMALREALDMAQGHAQHEHYIQAQSANDENTQSDLDPQATAPEQPPSTAQLTEANSDEVDTPVFHISPANMVMADVHKLMNDPFGRTDTKRWTSLLQDARLEGIDDANDFEDAFLYYLLENFGYFDGNPAKHNQNRNPKPITTRVATHIFNEMGWRDCLSRPLYMQDQLDWLRRDLDVINHSRPQRVHAQNPPAIIEQTDGNSKWIPIAIFCFYLLYLGFNAVSNAG